ncbi:MAG: hypothetical protein J5958_06390 [Clostridia bacterium]|nr:hypothetical protein [Clostridia bacterium]
MKFDPSVKREIGYVTLGTLLLTAIEIGVFFAFGYYTAKVLYGAILSAAAGILNFFLLAVTVTRALSYPPEEEAAAKGLLKLSRISRMLFLLALLAVGVIFFSPWSTLITIFLPRVIIAVRSIAVRRESAGMIPTEERTDEPSDDEGDPETKGSDENGTDEN